MEFNDVYNLINRQLPGRISSNRGLYTFARERKSFEDWVKVEIVDILIGFDENVRPEDMETDITTDKMDIEIKVAPTYFHYGDLIGKNTGLTEKLKSTNNDVKKLRDKSNQKIKILILLVFPLSDALLVTWKQYFDRLVLLPNKDIHTYTPIFFIEPNQTIEGALYIWNCGL